MSNQKNDANYSIGVDRAVDGDDTTVLTVGHREVYLATIAKHGPMFKYAGGYAVHSVKDAHRLIRELGHENEWAVWSVDAKWLQDTAPADDGWWHYLTCDADIIGLIDQSDDNMA